MNAYLEVTLAKNATCDACARPVGRGARAFFLATPRSIRCTACGPNAIASLAVPSSVAASAGAVASLTDVRPVLGFVVLGAAVVVRLLRSRRVRRALVTGAVATRSGFAWIWRRLRGEKRPGPAIVRRAFEDLGPTYVKLGQLVASSEGLFPERYCREFQQCLDRVRPFSSAEVMATLRAELGRDPAEVFASFDETPIASASIAQVHAARLKSGEAVVVKVQRPGLPALLAADLGILRAGARVLRHIPNGELASPVDVIDDFEANLREELDFRLEAANMDEFNRIMAAHQQDGVTAPRVMHELTTTRVLVMDRFFGHRIDDVERIRQRSIDAEEKLLTGMRAWFQCMIYHGFFHGDVHAGNLMMLDDGRIGFLDFGIVGRFSPARRAQVTDYLLSFASGDFTKLAGVMVAMGAAPEAVDVAALARDLEAAYEPILSNKDGNAKYADLIPAIMKTGLAHRLRMPRAFVLVTKQMLYFDRYAKLLAPRLNIFRDPRIVTALALDTILARAQQPRGERAGELAGALPRETPGEADPFAALASALGLATA